MKQITLNVPENKYRFFLELVKSLGFVKIEVEDDGDSDEEILENLKNGFAEMVEIKNGKGKTISAEAFLNDL